MALISFHILSISLLSSQDSMPMNIDTFFLDENHDSLNPIYYWVTAMPTISGGKQAMRTFLENYPYPKCGEEGNIEGQVILQLLVEKSGYISDIQVLKSSSTCLSKAAIEYVKNIPKWIPGKREENEVTCFFTIPITYELEKFKLRNK